MIWAKKKKKEKGFNEKAKKSVQNGDVPMQVPMYLISDFVINSLLFFKLY